MCIEPGLVVTFERNLEADGPSAGVVAEALPNAVDVPLYATEVGGVGREAVLEGVGETAAPAVGEGDL